MYLLTFEFSSFLMITVTLSWLSLFMESIAYISSFTEFPVRIMSEKDLSVDITEVLDSGRED